MSELFFANIDVKVYEAKMKRVSGGLTLAAAEALNTVGSFAHVAVIKNMKKDFRLKNSYSLNSMLAYPVNFRRSNGELRQISKMRFISGSRSPYLAEQDTGIKRRAAKKIIAIPTKAGRPNPNQPIPVALRLRKQIGKTTGNPKKLFFLPSGVYQRQGKKRDLSLRRRGVLNPRPLVQLRASDVAIQLKATKWFTRAMVEWHRPEKMQVAYVQAAKRILEGGAI